MKTTFAIVSVLFAVGLIAGIVVPPEPRSDASIAAPAEGETLTQSSHVPVASSRGAAPSDPRSAARSVPGGSVIAAEPAGTAAAVTAPVNDGAAVPLVDVLGVAGLLGGGLATVLLLQGGRPGRPQPDARIGARPNAPPDVPRERP